MFQVKHWRRGLPALAATGTALYLAAAVGGQPRDGGDQRHQRQEAHKAALAPWQGLVGTWRGVGQPQRGSTRGAWIETCRWRWQFDEDGAALVFEAPEGKYLAGGGLRPAEGGRFELLATRSDGRTHDRYIGAPNDSGELVLQIAAPQPDAPARITLRQVAGGQRLVLLLERRAGDGGSHVRLAEIGYTRQGGTFAQAASGPECIVTGGAGTIAVEHGGKTYYVCCTGCKQLFDDDPEGVIADYRARQAAR